MGVTLPDGTSTPGVIFSVGKVATGSGSSAAIPVLVRLDPHPQAAGALDQAPVTVEITTGSVRRCAGGAGGRVAGAGSGGGYAVEVAGANGTPSPGGRDTGAVR